MMAVVGEQVLAGDGVIRRCRGEGVRDVWVIGWYASWFVEGSHGEGMGFVDMEVGLQGVAGGALGVRIGLAGQGSGLLGLKKG